MTLASAKPTIFIAVTDAKTARAFYEDSLGLRCMDDTPFALVFDMNGVELRLSKVPVHTPLPFTVLDWQVADIHATRLRLDAKGIIRAEFDGIEVDEKGIWTSPDGGAQIYWFRDPDGNVLSVSQRR